MMYLEDCVITYFTKFPCWITICQGLCFFVGCVWHWPKGYPKESINCNPDSVACQSCVIPCQRNMTAYLQEISERSICQLSITIILSYFRMFKGLPSWELTYPFPKVCFPAFPRWYMLVPWRISCTNFSWNLHTQMLNVWYIYLHLPPETTQM